MHNKTHNINMELSIVLTHKIERIWDRYKNKIQSVKNEEKIKLGSAWYHSVHKFFSSPLLKENLWLQNIRL